MAELLMEDLMFEILLRLPVKSLLLPVKSLLRFRCVSKGWRNVIDSRYFVKSQLDYASSRPPSLLVVVRHALYDNAYDVVDLSWFCNVGSPLAYKELPSPWDSSSAYCVGQCNGLVCISDSFGALLWNPATRKKFVFDLPSHGRSFWVWGFGYDQDSDDYKVVAMEWVEKPEEEEECRCLVWIYSLRSRSWKRIDDFPYFYVGESGVLVNGALHWRVNQPEYNVISALHLGKLEYYFVPKPDYSSENTIKKFECLGVLDGRLYAVYYSSNYDDFDLWTMNEYGVKESWTMLIRCADCTKGFNSISVAYLRNNEALVFTHFVTDDSELEEAMYDGNENENVDLTYGCEFKTISLGRGYQNRMRSYGRLFGANCPYVYVSSLVCPQNGCN